VQIELDGVAVDQVREHAKAGVVVDFVTAAAVLAGDTKAAPVRDAQRHVVARAPVKMWCHVHGLERAIFGHVDAEDFGTCKLSGDFKGAVGQNQTPAREFFRAGDARTEPSVDEQNGQESDAQCHRPRSLHQSAARSNVLAGAHAPGVKRIGYTTFTMPSSGGGKLRP
jgi:hypothetical protein